MRPNRFDHWPCPIARSADLLGDPWIPMVLRECTYGVTRFDEFQKRLSISPNILGARLQRMVEQGILEKELYQERPPRYAYRLTPMGYDATLLLAAMIRFGNDWIFEEGQHPIDLCDRETGRVVRPLVIDELTGKPIDPTQVRPGPGPGFPAPKSFQETWFYPERAHGEEEDA